MQASVVSVNVWLFVLLTFYARIALTPDSSSI